MRNRIGSLGILLALGSLLFLGVRAHAISTAPALVLMRAEATSGSHVRIVRLDGVFPGQDLVQQPFPLQILIRETNIGAGYVLYDLSRGAFAGSSAALADGMSSADALAVVETDSPAEGAELLLLARDRIEVSLPADFPSGPAEALFFVIYKGTPLLSNAVAFAVEARSP